MGVICSTVANDVDTDRSATAHKLGRIAVDRWERESEKKMSIIFPWNRFIYLIFLFFPLVSPSVSV